MLVLAFACAAKATAKDETAEAEDTRDKTQDTQDTVLQAATKRRRAAHPAGIEWFT